VTSSIQTQINAKQASNTELTALGSVVGTGILQKTAPNTYTTLGTTAPITVSAGNIGMTQSSTSASGFLSSTDWNTFNNKQPALGYTAVNRAGDTMTGTLNLPNNGLTVGTNQLIVTSGNVGIGTTSPSAKLDVAGGIRLGNDASVCAVGLAGTFRYNGG
jgi:hypothetical protein